MQETETGQGLKFEVNSPKYSEQANLLLKFSQEVVFETDASSYRN